MEAVNAPSSAVVAIKAPFRYTHTSLHDAIVHVRCTRSRRWRSIASAESVTDDGGGSVGGGVVGGLIAHVNDCGDEDNAPSDAVTVTP